MKDTEFRVFLGQVELKTNLTFGKLAKHVGVSERTLRDWGRNKYFPSKDVVITLSQMSGVSLPEHEIIPKHWHVVEAAKKGGKKTYKTYGLLGDRESRARGH